MKRSSAHPAATYHGTVTLDSRCATSAGVHAAQSLSHSLAESGRPATSGNLFLGAAFYELTISITGESQVRHSASLGLGSGVAFNRYANPVPASSSAGEPS